LWDTRQLKHHLSNTKVGGGVWRLKWDTKGKRLLCVCMYNGVHVLDCSEILDRQPVSVSYMDHNSLVYGGDWCCLDLSKLCKDVKDINELPSAVSTNCTDVVASCSFYGHTLNIWTF